MAKNSKVATKKATKSKVIKAPAKKKFPAKKVVVNKAAAKKVVKKAAKPVEKKKVIVKKAPVKTKVVAKKAVVKTKVVAKKAVVKTKVVAKKAIVKTKVVAKKAAVKTKVVAKKAVVKTKVVAKKAAVKTKVVAKKAVVKTKVVAKKAAVKTKVVAKKVVAKAVKKTVNSTTNKKGMAKSAKPSIQKELKKGNTSKAANLVIKKVVVPIKTTTTIAKKSENLKAIITKVVDVKVKVLAKNPNPTNKAKPSKFEDKGKGKTTAVEKVEPLQAKAAKAMKELEETMDMSKVRPRLQAGSPPPKVVRPKEPPLKLIEPTNTLKQKYSLEFEFRSSPRILFNTLFDASGLAGWFADEVHTKDSIYTFYWDQGSSQAKMVAMQEHRLIRFQWLEDTDGTYFQFEIKEDDITSDVALIITDFALKAERDTQIRLWESQIQQLKMFVGSL